MSESIGTPLQGRGQRRIAAVARRNGYSDPIEFVAVWMHVYKTINALAVAIDVPYNALKQFIKKWDIKPKGATPSQATSQTDSPPLRVSDRPLQYKILFVGREPQFEIEVGAKTLSSMIDAAHMVLDALTEQDGAASAAHGPKGGAK